MVFSLKAPVFNSSTRYSTGLRISPTTSSCFKASVKTFLASSRSLPRAKTWPNCESANSWIAPLAPTLK